MEQEPLDHRLLAEEKQETEETKLIPIRIRFCFAWLFWSLAVGIVTAPILADLLHSSLDFPKAFVLGLVIAVVGGFLLALATILFQTLDLRRWRRNKNNPT